MILVLLWSLLSGIRAVMMMAGTLIIAPTASVYRNLSVLLRLRLVRAARVVPGMTMVVVLGLKAATLGLMIASMLRLMKAAMAMSNLAHASSVIPGCTKTSIGQTAGHVGHARMSLAGIESLLVLFLRAF